MSETAPQTHILNPLEDVLYAAPGTDGTYIVLATRGAGEQGSDLLWRCDGPNRGGTPAQWLASMWRRGRVNMSRWENREAVHNRGAEVARFAHDCELCTFLGRAEVDGREADVWDSAHSGEGFVVRFSSEGPDYVVRGGPRNPLPLPAAVTALLNRRDAARSPR